MRRSAAPSQAARQKFVAPFLKSVSPISSCQNIRKEVKPGKVETVDKLKHNVLKRIFPDAVPASSESELLNNRQEQTTYAHNEEENEACTSIDHQENVQPAKKPRFQARETQINCPDVTRNTDIQDSTSRLHTFSAKPRTVHSSESEQSYVHAAIHDSRDTTETGEHCGYFNVVWCKRSNKKHKKWEGDAVLVTKGRSVTLYDTEGKEIGKGTGYKSTELASLKEDETLPIGGKEIQVMSLLTEAQFKSGKCFSGTTASVDSQPTAQVPSRAVFKPFSKPLKPGHAGQSALPKPEAAVAKPRHDPGIPGALVLPRPSDTHQWENNRGSLPVVDVVVDPFLSCHLRPHQRVGVTFLYECVMGFRSHGGQGAILADDMGLGKTLQCISLIWTLYKQGPYGGKPVGKRFLIVTPGSLVKNWYQEFKKWLGFERIQVFAVGSDKKVEDFIKTTVYPVLVISYEMFVRVYEKIQQLTFDLLVCDEGHRLKNTNIKTTSLIMSLPVRRRVVLTGTPIQNDLQEFYSIVEFCNPGVLGSSAAFKRVYEDPIVTARQPGATKEELSLGEERGAELSRMTQMFVLRRTQEINNKYLPPKREIVVFCRPTPLQLRLYHQLLRCQLIRSCLAGSMAGSPHLICIAALKQLCNHPALIYSKSVETDDNGQCGDYDQSVNDSVYEGLFRLFPDGFSPTTDLEEHAGKLAVLSALLHELHTADLMEKIVVVSNHTKTLDLIQCLCDEKSYRYLRLDGQTPTGKRQELVQRFNNRYSQEFIFLLSSKAGGVGLNLVGASRLVLYDIDWNPANDLQAMARVWRDGQMHVVHIYRFLTTGTIEEKIYQRQISKQSLSGAVMDAREKTNVQFSLEDLRDLFSINSSTDCDTHDLLNCDCTGQSSDHVACTPVNSATARACQLGGARSSQKKRNVGMDELMEWKHLPGSVVHEQPSWYLQESGDHISYIFYSEVKGQS